MRRWNQIMKGMLAVAKCRTQGYPAVRIYARLSAAVGLFFSRIKSGLSFGIKLLGRSALAPQLASAASHRSVGIKSARFCTPDTPS
jgi:hypothetical protein